MPPRAASDLLERALWSQGYEMVAGLDEVGRGPLAGEVVASAVLLGPGSEIPVVADSKALTPEQRRLVVDGIVGGAVAVGIGWASPGEIDRLNILGATKLAMARALQGLAVMPSILLLDAITLPDIPFPQISVVKGDALCRAIAAASIVAKVFRDNLMVAYDEIYPGYGFSNHKGYAASTHFDAIRRLGTCPIHRMSFLGGSQPTLFGEQG